VAWKALSAVRRMLLVGIAVLAMANLALGTVGIRFTTAGGTGNEGGSSGHVIESSPGGTVVTFLVLGVLAVIVASPARRR
jgi:hypothetical protein